MPEEIEAPLVVRVGSNFAVRFCEEGVAARFQLVGELTVVVNLTVANHNCGWASTKQRLMPALHIDYRKPAVPEHDAWRGMNALVIRSAVGDAAQHGRDGPCVEQATRIQRSDPRNPAH